MTDDERRQVLDAWLAQAGEPIELAHIGQHLGVCDDLDDVAPDADELRAVFRGMGAQEQATRLHELEWCPW